VSSSLQGKNTTAKVLGASPRSLCCWGWGERPDAVQWYQVLSSGRRRRRQGRGHLVVIIFSWSRFPSPRALVLFALAHPRLGCTWNRARGSGSGARVRAGLTWSRLISRCALSAGHLLAGSTKLASTRDGRGADERGCAVAHRAARPGQRASGRRREAPGVHRRRRHPAPPVSRQSARPGRGSAGRSISRRRRITRCSRRRPAGTRKTRRDKAPRVPAGRSRGRRAPASNGGGGGRHLSP
jgi:hypothetical protein